MTYESDEQFKVCLEEFLSLFKNNEYLGYGVMVIKSITLLQLMAVI